MSKIEKKYWVWDEKFNESPYSLDMNVDSLIKAGDFVKFNKDNYYCLNKSNKYLFEVSNGKIKSILFKEGYDLIKSKLLWDLESDIFIIELNKRIPLCKHSSNFKGDVLKIVFRDFFVSFIQLKRM